MFPVSRTREPNSPIARAKASPQPATIAGVRLGRMMLRKILRFGAPSEAAASSISLSSSIRTGWTARTTNGRVTNRRAATTAARVYARWIPTGEFWPYRARSVSPATMVGSAKGRSITELRIRLPGNSSRTSTHAISVPITALIATTISEVISVSLIADWASGAVIESQKCPRPSSKPRLTTAASGSSTMRLTHRVAVPRASAAPPRGTRRPALGGLATAVSADAKAALSHLAGRVPEVRLGLGHPAVVAEERIGDLRPTAEVVDREQPRRDRELVRVLVEHGLDHRSISRVRERLLSRVAEEVVDERLRRAARVLGDRDRVLDQDRAGGRHVLEVDALLIRLDRLVLVADQHVALAARERVERVSGAVVLNRGVIDHLLDEVLRLRLGLAGLDLRPVDGHDVPAGAARGGRVRIDDLDVAASEVGEGLDVLRVPRPHHQGDDRVRNDPLVLVLIPVGRDDPRVDQPRHVRLERELDDVGRLPGLDGAALIAR